MKKTVVHFLFLLLPFFGFCQEQELKREDKLKFGLGYSFNLNKILSHHSVDFILSKRNIVFFAGPEFTIIKSSLGDPVDSYKSNNYGAQFGFRYMLPLENKIFEVFPQLKFSIYPYSYSEHTLGSGTIQRKYINGEYTLSLGMRLKPTDFLSLIAALGFCSPNGLNMNGIGVIPTLQLGVITSF